MMVGTSSVAEHRDLVFIGIESPRRSASFLFYPRHPPTAMSFQYAVYGTRAFYNQMHESTCNPALNE